MNRCFSTPAAWLIALAALVSGCGTINVAVDVLDPEHVRGQMDEVALRKLYRDIQRATPGDFAKRVDKRFRAFATEVRTVATAIRKTAGALPAERRTPIERSAVMLEEAVAPAGTWRQGATKTGADLEALAHAIRDESARQKYAGHGPLPGELRISLADFQSIEKALRDAQAKDVRSIETDLRTRVAAAAQASAQAAAARAPAANADAVSAAAARTVEAAAAAPLAAVAPAVAAAVSAALRSIIGDGSLAATEFAYVVASAPDPLWKHDFNRAFADTKFGNADMVIKLNSTADFSVKGLLFDASKVAQVASKVLTQTVLVGAQVAGVPVPTASSGTQSGGDALSKSSSDLAAADATLATRDARATAQKTAIRSLARSLLATAPQLAGAALAIKKNDDAERKALHDSIDSSFGALKSLLSLEDLQ